MYTFIINPNARSGLGGKVWAQIEETLKNQNVCYQALFTRYQRHATMLVRDLTSDGNPHTLIVLGGDGTVNEVINGISDFKNVTLGYIPIGSSNDFARYFGYPSDPIAALNAILTPRRFAMMNIGLLSYHGKERRFAVSTGMGFDAGVCHQAVVSKVKVLLNRLHLGRLTYVLIALQQMLKLRPGTLRISLDNGQEFSYRNVLFAAVMNHPYEGGGFKFCPKASPTDNVMDVIVISGVPKLKALLLLPTAFFGLHTFFYGVNIYTCRTAEFFSEKALPIHTDGEPVYLQKHTKVCLLPENLRLILP